MSNHDNHRRGETKSTPTGPRWENHGEGDAPHVARARSAWKKIGARAARRSGGASTGGYFGSRRTLRIIDTVKGDGEE